jgi:hypothetical protein
MMPIIDVMDTIDETADMATSRQADRGVDEEVDVLNETPEEQQSHVSMPSRKREVSIAAGNDKVSTRPPRFEMDKNVRCVLANQFLRKQPYIPQEIRQGANGLLTAAILSAAVALGAALFFRLFRRQNRARRRNLPSQKAFLELLSVRTGPEAGGALSGIHVVASDLCVPA